MNDDDLAIGQTDNDLTPPVVRRDDAAPVDPLTSVEPSVDVPVGHSSSPDAPRTNDEK